MLKFIKQIAISALILFNSLLSVNLLECISMKNQKYKVRPENVDINSNNPIFYPFSIKVNKCSGNCNNISDPYTRICVPDIVKNLNVKVFNLMALTNETRHIKWHETCKCICRSDKIICNSKQRWNKGKRGCECKELIDKGVYNKGFIFNPSNCECECDKSCNTDEYLNDSNCTCRKKLVHSLIEICTKIINETKITNEHENNDKCNSYVIYKVLFLIFFIYSS